MTDQPDLGDILAGATIEPAPDDVRPTRVPRNQGVPELDPDVWKAFESGQRYLIGPVDGAYAHRVKLALQKSARYLSRIHDTDVRVTVDYVKLGGGRVRVRFAAHAPLLKGVAARQARQGK